jgi:hypothetical protein
MTARFYTRLMYHRDGRSLLFVLQAPGPPHEERYDVDGDKSTAQRFQLTMTISDSNAVTTINNATYRKAVTIGRDEEEITLCRSRMREVGGGAAQGLYIQTWK